MNFIKEIIYIMPTDNIILDEQNPDDIKVIFNIYGKNKIIKLDINNKNNSCNLSNHVTRLLHINNLDNIDNYNAIDFITFINDYNDILSFCTCCGKKIKSLNKISSCDKCKNKYYKLVTDNIVTDFYKNDKIAFNMIILTAYTCSQHPKANDIFKPFPEMFESINDLNEKTKYKQNNFNDLLKLMEITLNDNDIYDKIGIDDYSFLKFIILTNNTDVRSDLLFDKQQNIFDQKDIKNIFEQNEIITFQVRQNQLFDNKFNTNYPQYLFHGSSLANWYSIMRNGLKVLSGTHLMTTGAAYGSGIYLSNTLNISYGYGHDRYSNSGLNVIGVVQVLNDKQSYCKTNSIYVVPNENEVILRYIIVLRNNIKDLSFITNYFITKRQQEVANSALSVSMIRVKRMIYDYNKINKLCKKYGCGIEDDKDKYLIYNDNIKLLIKYPYEYPSSPPFICIIKMNREIKGCNILEKGGIVNDKLLNSKWKSNTKLHRIIKNIICSVTDNIIKDIEYDYNEAYEEFYKMML